MLERDIEKYLNQQTKARGGRALKLVSPGLAGVPDRIVLLPVKPEHQEIVAKYLKFVELKQPGKKPTKIQFAVMAMLRALGFEVTWTDSKEGIDEILAS